MSHRDIIKNQLTTIFKKYPEWASMQLDLQNTIIRRIERACYNKVVESCERDGIDKLWTEKKFLDRYSTECYRISSNLDFESSVHSKSLFFKLFKSEVDPLDIAELSNHELTPEAGASERTEILTRLNIKIIRKVSRLHICPKCHKNETNIMEFQGCAVDEGSSLSIECVPCGYVWRRR